MSPVLAQAAQRPARLDGRRRPVADGHRPRRRHHRARCSARVAGRFGLGRQLLAASALLALGSLASAAAPNFALLAVAQLPVGVGVAVADHGGDARRGGMGRARSCGRATLSWALVGQPAAWIVGMPLLGARRRAQLALRLARAPARRRRRSPAIARRIAPRGSRPAAVAARARPSDPRRPRARALAGVGAARERGLGGNARLRGRALRRVVRDLRPALTGCLLALAAGAYVAGNLTCRRLVAPRAAASARPARRRCSRSTDGLFGIAAPERRRRALPSSRSPRSSPAGGRWSRARSRSPRRAELRPAVTSLRAATMQFGYFAGSIAGGAALAIGGYGALGATMGLALPRRRRDAERRARCRSARRDARRCWHQRS